MLRPVTSGPGSTDPTNGPAKNALSEVRARRLAYAAPALVLLAVLILALRPNDAGADPCGTGNEIACENSKAGNDWTEWDVEGDGDPTIQGYATDISVDQGGTVSFKIKTDAAAYEIGIFRLGHYGGDGARKVATLTPSASLPQSQPACLTNSTGLIDCGNWSVSATWSVPSNAVSGVYVARPTRSDTGGASHIPFVVRDDDGGSDLIFQTSDTTWQAYNRYGGNSLYVGTHAAQGAPSGRAYKVSYNRPFHVRANEPASWLFSAEHAMIRWIERNGYDVSYTTGVDTARRGSELLEHKVFLSVGHDEYWSGDQRANVEAARDAGVSLGFFSGNDVFWKTRWEPSIDASSAGFRTLVCYKESAANAKIDPHPSWTGRWRDGRFSPPSDGGRPENALTGTLFQVQFRDDPIHVPAEDGRMRFWRHTSIAQQPAGGVESLPDGVLGYEWNEVPDNGLSPAGLMFLSSSTFTTNHYDSGGVKPVTHHLTLYRRPSGALVFSAGTIAWSYGLDERHDGLAVPEDRRMQQATMNLFADMGAQPVTPQSNLVPSPKSTDVTPPVSTITSPSAGQVIARGDQVTVRGTSSDNGGAVAVVEVSLDGGTTWRRVSGRGSWTYTGTMSGFGDVPIKVRATDDSGNTEDPPASVTVSAGPCPCSIWPASATPGTIDASGATPHELGLKFRSDIDGYVTGVRFYKAPTNTGAHVGHLWTKSGALLGEATFTGETASGWQTASFPAPIGINAGATYVVSYYAPNGHFSLDRPYFSQEFASAPLRAPADGGGSSGANGVYHSGSSAFPTSSYGASNYWVDVVFSPTAADATRPRVEHVTPRAGAWRADLAGDVTVGFTEAVARSSINASTLELRGPGGSVVPATVTYDAESAVARLDPAASLQAATSYTAVVRGGSGGVTDLAGNALAEDFTWTFKTATPGSCPCTIWPDSAVPASAAVSDGNSYELGVKFRADMNGFVKGIRFFKGPGNTGTHLGRIWTAAGQLVAEATFYDETPSGWQEVSFGAPVPISGGTTYVASYTAPNGHYALTRPFFSVSGVDNPPLHALAEGVSGVNGVYRIGSGFPTTGFSSSNYWVDLIFDTDGTDNVAPRVISTSPRTDANGVAIAKNVVAAFTEPIVASSVNSGTFELRDSAGQLVPASVAYDAATRSAVLDPTAPLALDSTYTATIVGGSSGVRDPGGNYLAANHRWTFRTAVPRECPCSLWTSAATPAIAADGDTRPHELGVRFRSDLSGYIAGIRFYKGSGNTGTHIGRLWTAGGTELARVTFTGETASGWQEARFDTAVPISAHTTYVASYQAPNGRFSVTRPYFASGDYDSGTLHALGSEPSSPNGIYLSDFGFPTFSYQASNYWVDVVFERTANDTSPPRVAATTPAAGARNVNRSSTVTARFTEPVDSATVTDATFELRSAGGAVAGTVTYDAATSTATFQPSASLGESTEYTATLRGGSSGIKDVAGNPLADTSWTFTTIGPSACPCSIWPSSATPAVAAVSDTAPYELGVKFRSEVDGFITGIRFYKGAGNTGQHVGRLWSSTGTLLGSAPFVAETATGWQETTFGAPVPIFANTTYVASYILPAGRFSMTRPFFSLGGVANPPLHALAEGVSGPNGVYRNGSGFPTASYQSTNYWVDVVFTTS